MATERSRSGGTAERPAVLEPLTDANLYDPLSAVTRAERKHLLLVSLISLALTWADLLPTKVEALGIEISTDDRVNLIRLLGLTVLYFLAAFATYAATDLARLSVARSIAQRRSNAAAQPVAEMARKALASSPAGESEQLSLALSVMGDVSLGRSAGRRTTARIWLEVPLPIVIAAAALLGVVAELTYLDDPITLLKFTWAAAPVATSLLAGCLTLLVLSVRRRYRGVRYKLPIRMRLAHRIIALAKLVPFSKKLQQTILRWGLRAFGGKGGGS